MWGSPGRGWSHARIAKAFGMSRPGVTQLMNKYPPAEDIPQPQSPSARTAKPTHGAGKARPPRWRRTRLPRGKQRQTPQTAVHPWALNGSATRMVEQLLAKMAGREIPEDMTAYDKDRLAERLVDLSGAIEQFLKYLHE